MKLLRDFVLLIFACNTLLQPSGVLAQAASNFPNGLICGDERLQELYPVIKSKHIALVVNQTAMVGNTHLVDKLRSLGIQISKIFSPEHGFRGDANAGENVKDMADAKTGIPVISLYGEKKKPSAADLAGIDDVIFDIQDVGTRCYTFISTLHYVMEACAENNVELIVLDRPNPNGWYVDGPVLQKEFQSFVGIDPVPLVYGLTVAEYAQMVNGEKWLPDGMQCKLKIFKCVRYEHSMRVSLPIKPSPNLPDSLSVLLYPSLCLFEGTNISVGRGTDAPFQVIGSPGTKFGGAFEFTPESNAASKSPPFMGQKCYGFDFRGGQHIENNGAFTLHYVIEMYKYYADKAGFFLKNNFFDKLAGTDGIRKMIIAGKSETEIRESYQKELDAFKQKRKKYLLYKDF